MELISYSIENKNIFWVHLGFQVCKLSIDLDKIYTNIGKFNFYKTNRESKLFFSYIRNINYKNFLHVGSSLDSILNEDYDRMLLDIQYNEKSIPIIDIFLSITKFFVPEYNYTIIYSIKKQKSITNTDFMFIQETFDKIEQVLNFITQEIVYNSQCSPRSENVYSYASKLKLASYIKKFNRKIIRLRKYLLEIEIRQ